MMSKIIVSNGARSGGKTSIARAIQHLSNQEWLIFGVDTLIEMTPYPSPGKDAEYCAFVPGENSHDFDKHLRGILQQQIADAA